MKSGWWILAGLTVIVVVALNFFLGPVTQIEYRAQKKRITRLERIAVDNGMWPAGEPTPVPEK